MKAVPCDRLLDFAQLGMWWEITHTTADTGGARFEAINVLAPEFAGPPLHLHPAAEESYTVVAGTLDVCLAGEWSRLGPGESVTVPAGTAHTLRNTSGAEVRLVNVHEPALAIEPFFRGLHALACSGRVQFPPKSLRSAILISMLFASYPHEIESVRPPRGVMKALALVGKLLRYKLPT